MDLDVLVRQSNDNPVYYVQYAHARIASLLRNAAEIGVAVEVDGYEPALLEHPAEEELLATLARFPAVVSSSAELREPHRIARYLEELATAYHKFYDSCRVLPRGDEEVSDLHRSRLILCAATRQVLANGLDLLGVTAPERM
jgi:arginyl-tRNA synthetase